MLKIAETPDGPELQGEPSVAAYRALARSRGVDLEVVLRAVVRDELRDIAAMPPVTSNRHGSGPVPDTRAVDGVGRHNLQGHPMISAAGA